MIRSSDTTTVIYNHSNNNRKNNRLILLIFLIDLTSGSYCAIKHINSSTPTTGIIESPGFPSPYSAPLDCVFNISTDNSNVIQLFFLNFDLAEKNKLSNQCLDAYLLIVVVDRHGRHHVGERLCGNSLPAEITTMQSGIQVQFVTTTSKNYHKGFKIQYRILSEEIISEPRSFVTEPIYSNVCGGHSMKNQLSGEITSPGYPLTYPRNSTCNWLIRVERGQRIYIRIVHLHLAPTIAECDRASLTILDGYKHESTYSDRNNEISEARFCGSQLYYSEEGMKSYMSSDNRLLVRFITTDNPPSSMLGAERVGFKIIWTAVEGLLGENENLRKEENERCNSQFVCDGGQICVEQGHGICASRSRLCISKSLVCDGVHNCVEGDFSDEQHCYSREIVTSAALGFTFIVLTMLIFVCCDQIRKRRRLRELIRERRNNTNNNNTSNGKCTRSNNVRLPPNR
ncbi:unnamed protein product [Caenorhabditis angaria]|uniref:CUB domain-containing protein n=1 Tax=Caenorhabditis angaria TaxID=860376 RepID=A0A9P1I380_9PELO|nr:unnamed protein product [Caenorhabditis angaria]